MKSIPREKGSTPEFASIFQAKAVAKHSIELTY
jgi:hypothetical protein